MTERTARLTVIAAAASLGGCVVISEPSAVRSAGESVYFSKEAVRCVGYPEVEYNDPSDGELYSQGLVSSGYFYEWDTAGLPAGEYWVTITCRRGYDAYPSPIHFAAGQDALDDEAREWFVYAGDYADGWNPPASFWYFAAFKDGYGYIEPLRR
jgi:hypothetical protein